MRDITPVTPKVTSRLLETGWSGYPIRMKTRDESRGPRSQERTWGDSDPRIPTRCYRCPRGHPPESNKLEVTLRHAWRMLCFDGILSHPQRRKRCRKAHLA